MHLKKKIFILFLLLGLAVFLGMVKGAVTISVNDLFLPENSFILKMRLMRTIAAMLLGSSLAVSGIVLQAILKNPLAEPYLLGTSGGAGLAAVTAVIIGVSRMYIPVFAFAGAVASIIIVYNLAREGHRVSDKSLILSGVIVSVAFSSVIVLLVSLFGDKAQHEINWWLWGNLQIYDHMMLIVIALITVVGVSVIYLFAQDLNAISMGDEEAIHLGVDVYRMKKILILITALMTAGLICISGIIGFVGLIVPHIMRLLVGQNHKILIPTSCLAASVFMIICDVVSRTVFAPVEIPIGVITAMIGSPIFIVLLKRRSRT